MPMLAAWAVRTLALTETFMPIKPQAPERTAPKAKPTAVFQPRAGTKAITTKRMTPTTAMVEYCLVR